jgi:hypothetical protein
MSMLDSRRWWLWKIAASDGPRRAQYVALVAALVCMPSLRQKPGQPNTNKDTLQRYAHPPLPLQAPQLESHVYNTMRRPLP